MKRDDLIRLTLTEAPIGDIHHIGNWDKNSSFRASDRAIVRNPVIIQKMRQRFGATTFDFQIFFVNSPEANKHTEVGQVDWEWLGREMPNTCQELRRLTDLGQGIKEDSINIVFTNNKGAQRVPMTPWIMAHRIGHVLRRAYGRNGQSHGSGYAYREAENYLIQGTSDILEYDYGQTQWKARTDLDLSTFGNGERGAARQKQMLYKSFWSQIGTFRSAREQKLREYFEMLNELIAQYITTGGIKFNPLPEVVEAQVAAGWGGKRTLRLKPDADRDATITLANTMEYAIGDILSNAVSHIYVM